MFPLLLALGRRLPILGDIIVAFEGKSQGKKGVEKEKPRPVRREGPGNVRSRPPQKRYNPEF